MRGGRGSIRPGCARPSSPASRAPWGAPGSKPALRAADAFTVRRARIVLASAEGRRPRAIAGGLRCAVRTARDGIRAFDAAGVAALEAGSSRPKGAAPVLGEAALGRLRASLHRPRRAFGHARGAWTLALLAEAARGGAGRGRAAGRDGPAGAAAPGRGPEAGRAPADQPRSRPRAKKAGATG